MFFAWRVVLIGCWGTVPTFFLAALVLTAFVLGTAGSLVLTARNQTLGWTLTRASTTRVLHRMPETSEFHANSKHIAPEWNTLTHKIFACKVSPR